MFTSIVLLDEVSEEPRDLDSDQADIKLKISLISCLMHVPSLTVNDS